MRKKATPDRLIRIATTDHAYRTELGLLEVQKPGVQAGSTVPAYALGTIKGDHFSPFATLSPFDLDDLGEAIDLLRGRIKTVVNETTHG